MKNMKSHKTLGIFYLLFFVVLNGQAQSHLDINLEKERVISSAGYAFQPIKDWKVNIHDTITNMSFTNERNGENQTIIMALVEADKFIIRDSNPQPITSPEVLFDIVINSLTENTTEKITEKEAVLVSGIPGQVANFQSNGFGEIEDVFTTGRLSMALYNQTHVFIMVGFTFEPDKWEYNKEFNAILKSIRFFEPSKPQG